MRRPREAVGAAMLAAAIGIDRAVEGDVGRVVGGDDLFRRFFLHRGTQWRQEIDRAPAIVELLTLDRLEAAGAVRLGAAAVAAVVIHASADDEIVHRLGRADWSEFANCG